MDTRTTRKTNFPAAAILFAVIAVFDLISLLQMLFIGYFQFTTLLSLAALIFFTITLFRRKADILLLAGIGTFTLAALINTIAGGFNFLSLIGFIGILGVCALYAINILPQLEQYKQTANTFWFIPPILFAVQNLGYIMRLLTLGFFNFSVFFSILLSIASAAAIFLAAHWITCPETESDQTQPTAYSATGSASGTYSISLVAHILLLIFTFGIWEYVWVYRTTEYLNRTPGIAQRNPVTKLLLCMFIPFYPIYWTYKSAQSIDILAGTKGIHSDLSMICLVLSIFIGIVPPILMQDKINAIEENTAI